MSFFPCCEVRCRLISDSRLTACGRDKSYYSLLNVFTQKSFGVGVGQDYLCAKEGLMTLFHLFVGSVSLLMPADWRQYCCHQNEQSWIRLLIWLKNNLGGKKICFQILPLTCCAHHLWRGGGDGSGSPGWGAEWKCIFWQQLPPPSVKAHWKAIPRTKFTVLLGWNGPWKYLLSCVPRQFQIT